MFRFGPYLVQSLSESRSLYMFICIDCGDDGRLSVIQALVTSASLRFFAFHILAGDEIEYISHAERTQLAYVMRKE